MDYNLIVPGLIICITSFIACLWIYLDSKKHKISIIGSNASDEDYSTGLFLYFPFSTLLLPIYLYIRFNTLNKNSSESKLKFFRSTSIVCTSIIALIYISLIILGTYYTYHTYTELLHIQLKTLGLQFVSIIILFLFVLFYI